MHYDIAIKRLMELGGTGILRTIAGLDLKELHTLDELPQEQTALLRCDYAAQFTDMNGEEGIVLVEFQTRWQEDKILDLVAYTVQRMRRHQLPVIPIMLLFNPHSAARDTFERGPVRRFEFRLVKIWEINAVDLLATDQPSLWALSPLTHDGVAAAGKVDNLLHTAPVSQTERSDLLTIFAILMGMRDTVVTQQIIDRRRELMIESPFYEMIKAEGREEGFEKGLEKGIEEGFEKGRKEHVESLRGSLLDFLSVHLGEVPPPLQERIACVEDVAVLRQWLQMSLRCQSLAEFEKRIAG